MQKFIFIEAHPGGPFGLENINPILEQGWKVIEIHASKPSHGDNIHALVLIEKDKSIVTKNKQRIICLNQGSGSAHDTLNDLLNEGWVIKQMQTGSDSDGSCCFVWLEKQIQ